MQIQPKIDDWPYLSTLVLLPGMDGTGELFEPLLEVLPSKLSVKVVRYPTQEVLNYSQLELLTEEMLPKAGPLILLGESFSGPIAMALAARLGDRVAGLVLCCTFVRSPSSLLKGIGPLSGLIPFEFAPNWVAAKLLLGNSATPKLRVQLRKALESVSPSVLRGRLREIARLDARTSLASCEMPILYLRASKDVLVPNALSEEVVSLRPSADLKTIEGPHCLLQAAPKLAASVIAEFVQKIEKSM